MKQPHQTVSGKDKPADTDSTPPLALPFPSVGMAPFPEETDEGGFGRRAVNATAYRIFKMLQWLMCEPLSVEALNQRFVADPQISKSVSSDSIWLYVNTLKALGCQVRRPSLRNGFCYELLYHPFGLPLNETQAETLARAKAHAQQRFNHQEMLVLDRLLKKIIGASTAENREELIERVFEISRSADYETCRQHIELLERSIATDQLLSVTYLSPLKGHECFHLLPELLYYEQGVVYARGERPEYPEPSSLRVDRIQALDTVNDASLSQSLLARRKLKTEAVLRIFPDNPDTFQGFGLAAAHGVYEEQHHWFQSEAGICCEIRLMVRDFFYIKQKLLSCGHRFQVVSPDGFREELQETLEMMRRIYRTDATESEVNHGAC